MIARGTSAIVLTPGPALITDLIAPAFFGHPKPEGASFAGAISSIQVTIGLLIVADLFGVSASHHHAHYDKGFLLRD